eukprot:NODE_60_length_25605_cov_0.732377.p8 type:complete len:287 gc:universal NODE_60_length_25605_cov_0.732377:20278-19418(-)
MLDVNGKRFLDLLIEVTPSVLLGCIKEQRFGNCVDNRELSIRSQNTIDDMRKGLGTLASEARDQEFPNEVQKAADMLSNPNEYKLFVEKYIPTPAMLNAVLQCSLGTHFPKKQKRSWESEDDKCVRRCNFSCAIVFGVLLLSGNAVVLPLGGVILNNAIQKNERNMDFITKNCNFGPDCNPGVTLLNDCYGERDTDTKRCPNGDVPPVDPHTGKVSSIDLYAKIVSGSCRVSNDLPGSKEDCEIAVAQHNNFERSIKPSWAAGIGIMLAIDALLAFVSLTFYCCNK